MNTTSLSWDGNQEEPGSQAPRLKRAAP